MSFTLCTSGQAIVKAGINASSTITASGSTLAGWSDEAEHFIATQCQYDVIANWEDLTDNGKSVLGTIASSMIAQRIVAYDLNGYLRSEAQTILDVLENDIVKNVTLIKEEKFRDYLGIT